MVEPTLTMFRPDLTQVNPNLVGNEPITENVCALQH